MCVKHVKGCRICHSVHRKEGEGAAAWSKMCDWPGDREFPKWVIAADSNDALWVDRARGERVITCFMSEFPRVEDRNEISYL